MTTNQDVQQIHRRKGNLLKGIEMKVFALIDKRRQQNVANLNADDLDMLATTLDD